MNNFGYTSPDGRKILPPRKGKWFNLTYVKLIAIAVFAFFSYMIITVSGYEIIIKCDRKPDLCVITKSSFVDPIPVELGKFKALPVIDIRTKSRILPNGKSVFDLQLDYGGRNGLKFIGFYYNSVIKANTTKMKLMKYIEDGSVDSIEIKKHCYFDEYFCF